MDVYAVDGTYELFRYFFALPSHVTSEGREAGATRGVLGSMLGMLESGTTHLGVATDHVIESFRNDLWAGYKTGEGIDPRLWSQFPLLEEGLAAIGIAVWPMVEVEADDALAAVAAFCAASSDVDRVFICSPDKDLAQCVVDGRVLQLDRRSGVVTDEAGVIAKFGVPPRSIPDYLALVGDSADGYPGLPGWGSRSAATLLARYGTLEAVRETEAWDVAVRGADRLRETLREQWDLALLFRDLARLRTGQPKLASVDELRWKGPADGFEAFCRRIDAPRLIDRVAILTKRLEAKT
ncbi:MAG TPA: 5'-3' exonuclease H3TH domain-containing protein [Dehalococcoidia bacterium]|nr:5'-3' exonuclease H3TH domain-containing protein [Dehalococcoidia bacterium]